jgi:hypothetical protein
MLEYFLSSFHTFSSMMSTISITSSSNITKETRNEVEKRLNKPIDKLLKIDSVMMMTDVTRWEINVQLISDIMISRDGIPGTIRNLSEKQHVPFHLACIDLLYKDKFHIPRIAAGIENFI